MERFIVLEDEVPRVDLVLGSPWLKSREAEQRFDELKRLCVSLNQEKEGRSDTFHMSVEDAFQDLVLDKFRDSGMFRKLLPEDTTELRRTDGVGVHRRPLVDKAVHRPIPMSTAVNFTRTVAGSGSEGVHQFDRGTPIRPGYTNMTGVHQYDRHTPI